MQAHTILHKLSTVGSNSNLIEKKLAEKALLLESKRFRMSTYDKKLYFKDYHKHTHQVKEQLTDTGKMKSI